MSRPATGQCLCGSVRYRVTGPLRAVTVCHCAQCRQWHGHAGSYTNAAHADFALTASDDLAWYQSSPIARRGFCRNCGSSLFWEQIGGAGIGIAAGTLDPPTGLATVKHIFTGEKSDYYHLDAGAAVRDQSEDVQQQRISKRD